MNTRVTGLVEICAAYDLRVDAVMRLEGYGSLNYRISSGGVDYLLKYYTDPDEYALVRQEAVIVDQLVAADLPFQLPGGLRPMLEHQDGSFSRLLPFITGDLLSDVEPTDVLVADFGSATAWLDRSLLALTNPTVQARTSTWDVQYALYNAAKATHIERLEDRKLVDYYFDQFQHHVLPIQHRLRHSIIHGDLNDKNVVVDGGRVKGFIDFGDICYSPLINEVAIALTYLMLTDTTTAFARAKAFVQSYQRVLPLRREEVELLWLLIPVRLCVSVCHSAEKKAHTQDTDYILVHEQPAWALLHHWIAINPIYVTNFFLEAIGLPSTPQDTSSLLTARNQYIGAALSTSYREPIYMTRAAFQYMYDQAGNTFLDAYNNIPHVGHCHPRLSQVIAAQARRLNTNTRYLYPQLTNYAQALMQKFPAPLEQVFLVNSGSAASDLAVRIARHYTQVETVAILEHSYHGHTTLGISISNYKHDGPGGSGPAANVITLPLPKMYRGAFVTGEAYAKDAIQRLQKHIDDQNRPAAVIVEPISGCGGQVPLAPGYLKMLIPFLRANGILLIADEVQVGFGRLGSHFWGFEWHGIVPDIVIIGKPMGNGHPIGGVVTNRLIADRFANGMEFFSSFGGNPVSCAVAVEVLRIIEEEDLQANARSIGAIFRDGLLDLQATFSCIGDVRGVGLFIGIEFVDAQQRPDRTVATFVKEYLKEHYILVSTDGPHDNVLKLKPPLCFSVANVEQVLQCLRAALAEVQEQQ